MKVNWKTFKLDQNFFLKYFAGQMLSSLGILAILIFFGREFRFSYTLSPWQAPLFILSIILGIQLPAILHNAVHFNIKPRFLNELIGEVVGFLVLFGLGPFRISHFLHHAFADTDSDTHPPAGKGFFLFLATTQMNTIKVIRRKFLEIHGDTRKNHIILVVEMLFYYISLVTRVASLYLLLGPEMFFTLYFPAYLTNVFVFAHINYATHATGPDGTKDILNLNHNLYYKFVNLIGNGVYFHAYHHRHPNLYNPMKAEQIYAANK